MIPRGPRVERRVPGVAVVLVGVGRFPIVMAEMRLGEAHEHTYVVGGLENLSETQMRAGFAAVVVRVNVIDPKTFEALEGLASGVVSGERRANLRVVERHRRKKNARPVE